MSSSEDEVEDAIKVEKVEEEKLDAVEEEKLEEIEEEKVDAVEEENVEEIEEEKVEVKGRKVKKFLNVPDRFSYTQFKTLDELIEKTGYLLVQENGQRIIGPRADWHKPRPPKGCELFIGRIPRNVSELDLVPLCMEVGTVYQFRIMVDFSGSSRGFAFVKFSTPMEAAEALRRLNNYEIREGCHIGAVKSIDNCRLYVGGLDKTQSKEEIRSFMHRIMDGISAVIIYSDVADKTRNRGFAFVDFKSHRLAAIARRKHRPSSQCDHTLTIDWAEPEIAIDYEIMEKVKTLYVRNIMPWTDEVVIRRAFGYVCGATNVVKVKKVKDYAFVHFNTRMSAQKVLEFWNGRSLEGSELQLDWARPVSQEDFVLHKAMSRFHRKGVPSDPLNERGEFQRNGTQNVETWRGLSTCYAGIQEFNELDAKKATLTLGAKCLKFNFGEPFYQFFITKPSDDHDQKANYVCKVTLPKCLDQEMSFQTTRVYSTPIEAQIATCEMVGKAIRQGTLAKVAIPPGASFHYLLPLTPSLGERLLEKVKPGPRKDKGQRRRYPMQRDPHLRSTNHGEVQQILPMLEMPFQQTHHHTIQPHHSPSPFQPHHSSLPFQPHHPDSPFQLPPPMSYQHPMPIQQQNLLAYDVPNTYNHCFGVPPPMQHPHGTNTPFCTSPIPECFTFPPSLNMPLHVTHPDGQITRLVYWQ